MQAVASRREVPVARGTGAAIIPLDSRINKRQEISAARLACNRGSDSHMPEETLLPPPARGDHHQAPIVLPPRRSHTTGLANCCANRVRGERGRSRRISLGPDVPRRRAASGLDNPNRGTQDAAALSWLPGATDGGALTASRIMRDLVMTRWCPTNLERRRVRPGPGAFATW